MRRFHGISVVIAILLAAICFKIFWVNSGARPIDTSGIYANNYIQNRLKPDLVALEQIRIASETAVKQTEIVNENFRQAKILSAQELIPWKVDFRKWGSVGVLSVGCVSFLVFVGLAGFAKVREKSVHIARVNGAEIPIHHKDLSRIAPAITMMSQAEMVAAVSQQESFKMVCEANRVLKGHHTHSLQSGSQVALPETTGAANSIIPTCGELLQSGEIAAHKPMILGYEKGLALRGSFLDIFSAAIAGESGSGKTSTMLFLIASGLVSMGVRFIGLDPHYPHPKSLGSKTKPLWDAGLIEMATDYLLMQEKLEEVEEVITSRLKLNHENYGEVVLVIDELAFLNTTSIHEKLEHAMRRISTEGRKCKVYMLASSQSWLVTSTGKSSVVRDTLTSAYVHRIKPKQANLLLQDKDEVTKVKKSVKHAGEVLFLPVGKESIVCQMPYTTEKDMETVVDLVQQGNGSPVYVSKYHTEDTQGDTGTILNESSTQYNDAGKELVNTRKRAEKSLYEMVNEYLDEPEHTQEKLSDNAGISGKDLSQWRNGRSMKFVRKNRIEDALYLALQQTPDISENTGKLAKISGKVRTVNFGERKSS